MSTISEHYTFLKCPLYQNTTLSLSKLRPYLLVSTISKHYTFLITYSSVHHFKNTTHSLSKLRPYLLVSTLYQNTTTFLIKIASIFLIPYSSVHYIKTLHFPYQNCVHISYHIFKCPLYQNTTLSLSKLRPYFLSHIQVSTISKHYTFLIKIAPIFLITYSSVHYINTLHFPYQTCQNCVHRQMSTIPNGFIFPTLLSTISFTTLFLYSITTVGLVSCFEQLS